MKHDASLAHRHYVLVGVGVHADRDQSVFRRGGFEARGAFCINAERAAKGVWGWEMNPLRWAGYTREMNIARRAFATPASSSYEEARILGSSGRSECKSMGQVAIVGLLINNARRSCRVYLVSSLCQRLAAHQSSAILVRYISSRPSVISRYFANHSPGVSENSERLDGRYKNILVR